MRCSFSQLMSRLHFAATFCVLCAAFAPGCMWIDDFGKFKTAPAPDAGPPDSGSDSDASAKCRNVNCATLDSECERGMCNPQTGECEARPRQDGENCFDDNPCSYDDRCQSGKCMGKPLDCSIYDDECSQGMCDPKTGACGFGPNNMSRPCDDLNDCTLGDKCNNRGICEGDNAAQGAACSDLNPCTGTDARPDSCNADGRCISGGAVPAGQTCDDDSECTENDKCNGGECKGTPIREGEACNGKCTSNTVCRSGECLAKDDAVQAYNPRCVLNWCEFESGCRAEYENDRVCDCGCEFSDPDCSDCSPRLCQNEPSLNHTAVRWCDQAGKSVTNCPDTLKGDGACDCGCQFRDPDCEGKDCCSARDQGGCNNTFVEDCVCNHATTRDMECCTGKWTQRCVDLAINLGCMICP